MQIVKLTQIHKYHLPILSYADLGFVRGPGPGLGNLLFPIARALQGCEQMGGEFVYPTMRQIKIGPYLRAEKDKRTYGDLLRPRSLDEKIAWFKTRIMSKSSERSQEKPNQVICYEGLGRQFHDIYDSRHLIKNFLTQNSRQSLTFPNYDIAIHIRQGDFAAPSMNSTTQSTQLPLDWYSKALGLAFEKIGKKEIKGLIFTDGNADQLIEDLGLKNFKPEPETNALASIFCLSKAKVIIGSRSTFSLWASFLGEGIAIWPEGFELSKYKPIDPKRDLFI